MLPSYRLSYFNYVNTVNGSKAFDTTLEQFNNKMQPLKRLYLTCNQSKKMDDVSSKQIFQLVDNLSEGIKEEKDPHQRAALLLQRAVAYAELQNYNDALSDLDDYVAMEKQSVLGRSERAICQLMLNDYEASKGQNVSMKTSQVEGDYAVAIQLAPKNAYLYYNRGNFYVDQKNYAHAIDDYTRALQIDSRLAEAYYNRGLAYYYSGNLHMAQQDLSKAGELGLYHAYALSKQLGERKPSTKRNVEKGKRR